MKIFNKIPDYPDEAEILKLLNKTHEEDVPNWTSSDKLKAYEMLNTLAFHFFRKEIILEKL